MTLSAFTTRGPDMTDADRIRLAEAMGWKCGPVHTVAVMGRQIPAQRWIDPEGNDLSPAALPDPANDANDCEALIRWLQEKGYDIEIWWSGTAYTHRSNVNCRVKAKYRSDWERITEGKAYDDWKHGVCELALEVLKDE